MAGAVITAVKAVATWYSGLGAVATWAVNTVSAIALNAALNAVLSPNREDQFNQGRMIDLDLGSDAPRRLQIGTRGNGGVFTDWQVQSNDDPNDELYLIICLGEGPMGPITGIWADGLKVFTGTINHEDIVELTEFRNGSSERLRVIYHDGRPGQAADASLVAEGGDWDATRVGDGCAYVVVRCIYDPELMPGPPRLFFETTGAKLYDRRLDSTAGGSGSHRLTDPTTWEVTANPAVALDHYLLGRYFSGSETRPRMGVGLSPDDVPYDRFAALANLCDESVSLSGGGSQNRYEAHGFISADSVHKDVIADLCRAMDARPADFGGKISAISHASSTSVMTITDDDLIEGVAEIYTPKRSWAELVSGAVGTFQYVHSQYRPQEYPRVADAAWAAEDGGEAKIASFDLPFETDGERAQRLARLFVQRERRQAILTGAYHVRTIELEEGDWFVRSGARFGEGGKVFEVISPPVLNPNSLAVSIRAVEVDPNDSAWDNADADTVTVPTGSSTFVRPKIATPTVTGTVITTTSGAFTFTGIEFRHTSFEGTVQVGVEIEISEDAGGGTPSAEVLTAYIVSGREYMRYYGGILPGQDYVWRVRGRAGARVSDWSSWSTFTANPGAQFGNAVLGSNVFREDGSTLVSNADVITLLGTAAAVTGQGSLATANRASRRAYSELTKSAFPHISDITRDGKTFTTGTDLCSFGDTPTEKASVTLTCDGNPVELEFAAEFMNGAMNGPDKRIFVDIYRDTTKIIDRAVVGNLKQDADGEFKLSGGVFKWIDLAPGGTPGSTVSNDYSVRLYAADSPKSPFSVSAFVDVFVPSYWKASTYEDDANDVST